MRGPARAAVLAGGGLLALSLFLPWSHQFSSGFLGRYGTNPALRGVPRDPDAWQLYTFVDVLLALLAGALAFAAVRGSARLRRWLLLALLVALAVVVHALAVPPTNGGSLFDPSSGRYIAPGATAGIGETAALIGLALAAAGLLLGRRSTRP